MFEGTGQYFLILFIIYIVVFLTVKICLGKIFEDMGIASYKAYIPFYNRILLINKLDIKKSLFYKTLIPFANLYYYNIIIAELLKAYKLNPKDSTLFILIPMYKFPELIIKKPKNCTSHDIVYKVKKIAHNIHLYCRFYHSFKKKERLFLS